MPGFIHDVDNADSVRFTPTAEIFHILSRGRMSAVRGALDTRLMAGDVACSKDEPSGVIALPITLTADVDSIFALARLLVAAIGYARRRARDLKFMSFRCRRDFSPYTGLAATGFVPPSRPMRRRIWRCAAGLPGGI